MPRDPAPGDASSWSRSRGSTALLWTFPALQPPGCARPAGQPPWTRPHGRWIQIHRCPHSGPGTILTTFRARNPTLRSHPRPSRAARDGPTGAWEPCALWACSSPAPHRTDRCSSSRILQPLGGCLSPLRPPLGPLAHPHPPPDQPHLCPRLGQARPPAASSWSSGRCVGQRQRTLWQGLVLVFFCFGLVRGGGPRGGVPVLDLRSFTALSRPPRSRGCFFIPPPSSFPGVL